MTEKRSDKWVSLTLSVLVHGTIVGLLAWGFWSYKREKALEPQLAIRATVVDARDVPAETSKPTPPAPAPTPKEPPKVEPKPEPTPPPPPEDTARKEQERKEQERKVEEQRVAAERVEKEKAAEEKARQETERAAKERAEKEKAEKERQEKARLEKEKADQLAQQKAAEQKLQAQRETELRAQMAAEARVNALRNSSQMQQYLASITARIERAWIRPPSVRPGLSCQVRITQVPGGEVTGVQVVSCNGDDAVRQSIEAAAYRASPLPAAPDPALFDRNLVVTFHPED